MNNLEAFALALVGAAYTQNAETLDRFADVTADQIVSAVKSTETLIDDTAADAVSKLLRRMADRIDTGIASAVDQSA